VDGVEQEPVEEVIIEVPAEHVGTVQMELGQRRAILKEQFASPKGVTKLVYEMPTRSLLGMRNILMTNTKGTIVMNSLVIGHQPVGAALQQLRNGVLISFEAGTTMPYSLETLSVQPNRSTLARLSVLILVARIWRLTSARPSI